MISSIALRILALRELEYVDEILYGTVAFGHYTVTSKYRKVILLMLFNKYNNDEIS